MQLNQAGIDLIKRHEGCKLTAYPDPGTGGDPWTIAYGHTGPEVSEGLTITQDQADALLAQDLVKFSAKVVALLPCELSDNQFSALVSLAYNIGVGNLRSSSLLKFIKAADFGKAADEFVKWDRAAGKALPGLLKRREDEAALFRLG